MPLGDLVILRYKGDFPNEDLDGLAAVLTDGGDIFVHQEGTSEYDEAMKVFTGQFVFPQVPMNSKPLRIDFYLNSEYEKPIASWRIGKLYRHNTGLNADRLSPAD